MNMHAARIRPSSLACRSHPYICRTHKDAPVLLTEIRLPTTCNAIVKRYNYLRIPKGQRLRRVTIPAVIHIVTLVKGARVLFILRHSIKSPMASPIFLAFSICLTKAPDHLPYRRRQHFPISARSCQRKSNPELCLDMCGPNNSHNLYR